MKLSNTAPALGLSAIALLAATASPAFAQEETDARDIIVTAQQAQKQVVSDGDLGALGFKDALSTPFNVSSYTAQLVLDQQSETIGDVLENDPSVRTTYGSGNQSELFVIRGFALNGDDVSINGLYGVTPRQLVSPELYENIQVLNGASAFLFGAAPGGSGIGGGINLTTKHAEKSLYRVTGSFSADSMFGGNFDVGTRFGKDEAFGVRLMGVYRKGETPVEHDEREVRVFGAGLDFRNDWGRITLDFGYEHQRADWTRPTIRLNPGVALPTPPDPNYNYGQPWTFTKLRDVYAILRAEANITENLSVFMAGGFRDGREDGEYSTVTLTNAVTGAGTAARLFVPREDNNESFQAGFRGKFDTAGIKHEISGGGSLNYTENRNSFTSGNFAASLRSPCGLGNAVGTNFCTNIYNTPIVPKPTNSTLPSAGGDLNNLPRVSRGAFRSVYISDTISLFDERVMIVGGVRHQLMTIKAYNRASRLVTSTYNEKATTPVVGVIVKPTANTSLYANRIEGLAQGPTAPTNADIINQGDIFPPFRSVQYEIGGKFAIQGLTGTIALYQTKQPSAFTRNITPVPTTGPKQEFVVDGEQRNRGIEVSFNGEPTKELRFIGGFSINDAKITKSLNGVNNGKKAIGVPDYQINFGTEVVLPFLKGMTLTGRVVHTGPQYLDITNVVKLPSWTRFDLGARYVAVVAEHPVTLRLSAENIANKGFWYSSFGGYLLQGAPRTIKASMTFEY